MERGKKSYIKIPTEMQECRAYWQWVQTVPLLRDYLYKIVNEGKRSVIQGGQLKQIGLRAGLPDYHFPVANDNWYGFWLEMKTRKKSEKVMPSHQSDWLEKLRKIRQYATFAYGWEDAAEKTMSYLQNKV